MKIVIINGQNHKGSTYHIGKMLADKLGGSITEYFLPKDFDRFCTGCTQCFMKSEIFCPHYELLRGITAAMDEADVLIMTSPVYVYHATGSMKAFLDHYGYRFMIHRPEEKMFKKQAVCIATAAGAGMKFTLKDMADSLFFWGIPKIYRYGIAVRATSFETVDEKRKKKIEKKVTALAGKIRNKEGKVRVGLKTRGYFYVMRFLNKRGWNKADARYWNEKGWTGKARPWK
ncbi:MAG: NAD(P)H-dependent oxidoreductase [Lachnospiraceae bacterium]|nr:NAD(P)H-dependent oxidoreductase [Lachnospiraceae bacterium]